MTIHKLFKLRIRREIRFFILCSLLALLGIVAQAGGVRDHTRPTYSRETMVSESQAQVLTLTLAVADTYQLQTWLRVAGQIDATGKTLLAMACFADAALVQVGQRVITFLPEAKASISQARVSRVDSGWRGADRLDATQACVRLEATLAVTGRDPGGFYVMEIIVPRGRFLAVPNEAIIEEEGRSLVYTENQVGHYLRRVIHTGVKGERYTQVLDGLMAGERVVTLGSFFIHAQHKLHDTQSHQSSHAHHVH
ncbi:MAG: hypothetical protein GXP08_11960 [Gammaproteobacteria bacterium]|nr:hypothetical protein [Gammaproteobacteria bacterium]